MKFEDTLASLVIYIVIFKAMLIVGYSVLCFWWFTIARTIFKKTIFAFCGAGLLVTGGMLLMTSLIWIQRGFLVPQDFEILVAIAAIIGMFLFIVLIACFFITLSVRRRQVEMEAEEARRSQASYSNVKEKLVSVTDRVTLIGHSKGWL